MVVEAVFLNACQADLKRVATNLKNEGQEDPPKQNFSDSPEDQLFWFTHQREQDFVRLPLNSPPPFFLRGALVERFLQSASARVSYCLVFAISLFIAKDPVTHAGHPHRVFQYCRW